MQIEQFKRETEKAVLVVVEVENAIGRRAAEFWFPKSQVKIEGSTLIAPAWLERAKLVEKYGENVGRSTWFN